MHGLVADNLYTAAVDRGGAGRTKGMMMIDNYRTAVVCRRHTHPAWITMTCACRIKIIHGLIDNYTAAVDEGWWVERNDGG